MVLPRGRLSRCRGGLLFLPPVYPDFSFTSAPYSPTPFPGGAGGDQGYFMQGASSLASPGIDRARHWLCLRKPVLRALPGNTCFAAVNSASGQSIIEKKFLGVWGFFKKPPTSLPFLRSSRCTPPHAGRNSNCTKMRKTVEH